MLKKYGDTKIALANQGTDDEYQQQILHQSATVTSETLMYTTTFIMAILAWVLPEGAAIYSLLVLLPGTLAQTAGALWMLNYAPRPRPYKIFTLSSLPIWIFLAIAMAGIAFNDFNGELGGTIGMVVGAVVGGAAAAYFAPRWQRSQRRNDEERLDQNLED